MADLRNAGFYIFETYICPACHFALVRDGCQLTHPTGQCLLSERRFEAPIKFLREITE